MLYKQKKICSKAFDEIDDISELHPDSEFSVDENDADPEEFVNGNIEFEIGDQNADNEKVIRRCSINNRLVRSIDSSLLEENYEFIVIPEKIENYRTFMLKPTKKNNGDPIDWTNEAPLQTGLQSAENIIAGNITWFIQSGKSWKKVSFSTRVWKVLESHGKSWNNFLGSLKVMESHGIFSLLFIFICLHVYFKVQKKINSRKLYVLNLNNLWYKNLF